MTYVIYNILKVASVLMGGNWLFWPWKNLNVKISPYNLIFKNVSLIVGCNILNWSVKCLISSKCIYSTQKIKFNEAAVTDETETGKYVTYGVADVVLPLRTEATVEPVLLSPCFYSSTCLKVTGECKPVIDISTSMPSFICVVVLC